MKNEKLKVTNLELIALNKKLNTIFNMFIVDKSGNLIVQRELVGKINNLKLYIYPQDHNPPHFHIKSSDLDACFDIYSCELIKGNIDPKSYKKIKFWHKSVAGELSETWKRLNNTDERKDFETYLCNTILENEYGNNNRISRKIKHQ